jgi:biotin carboxyl carrier protein
MFETGNLGELVGEEVPLRERLVVAPCPGRFRPLPPEIFTSEGEWVVADQTVAEIHTGREVVPVRSNFEGWMMGMLVVPGQPVFTGEGLFWIRP